MKPRRLLGWAGRPLAALLRALPGGHRFPAMMLMSRAISPFLPLLPRYRMMRAGQLEGPKEEAMRLIIRAASGSVIEFDPDFDCGTAELVDATVTAHGCALILSGHFSLNQLLPRFLSDRGYAVSTVRAQVVAPSRIAGTTRPLHDIVLSPNLFVQMRNALRGGSIVVMDVDISEQLEDSETIQTAGGTRYVPRPVFDFAVKTSTPVLFGAARPGKGGGVFITFRRPPTTGASDEVRRQYCTFVREQAGLAP